MNRTDGYTFLRRDPPTVDDETTGEEVSGTEEETSPPAEPAPVTPQGEALALALHMDAEPTLRRPTAPAPENPDPMLERERIEGELGIDALAESLEGYGTPPVAPMAKHADRDALERELLGEALADISRWNVNARRAIRNEAREQASRQAQAEDERLAAERQQLQQELDARWAELQALRDRAAHATDEWITEEMRRRAAAQAALDSEWQQLIDADPDSVTSTLRATFPDGTVTVLGSLDGVAVLIVTCPDRDEVIAGTEPALTSAGRRTMRARPEVRKNHLYLSAIASRVLAAVGRALSTTPAVRAVTCVAVRAVASSDRSWEALYVGTFERAYAERLLSERRWTQDPDELAKAVQEAEDVDLELAGRAREISPLDLSDDPGLMAVMRQMDPAVRSNENAARASDEAAVKAFLDYADAEHDTDTEQGTGESAELGPDTDAEVGAEESAKPDRGGDATTHERQGRFEPTPDESPTKLSSDGPDASHNGAGSGTAGDPLRAALKDSDCSVRRSAVEAIGRLDDPNDTPLLLEALGDSDDNVRLEAMFALKDRLSPDLRRDALVKACSDTDDVVRRNAIEALAELGDERDTPLLLEALNDRNHKVRLQAIYAVKYRLAPHMRDALIKACTDTDLSVRRKAIEALAELGDERDTPLLLKALKDSDSSVRLEAIYALESRSMGSASRLSGPLLDAMRDEDATVRQVAVRLLGRSEQSRTAPRST